MTVPAKPKICLQENLVDCADCDGLVHSANILFCPNGTAPFVKAFLPGQILRGLLLLAPCLFPGYVLSFYHWVTTALLGLLSLRQDLLSYHWEVKLHIHVTAASRPNPTSREVKTWTTKKISLYSIEVTDIEDLILDGSTGQKWYTYILCLYLISTSVKSHWLSCDKTLPVQE